MDLYERARRYLVRAEEVRKAGVYPYFRAIEENDTGTKVTIEGRQLVMAGSNNYLGLTHDPRVMAAARDAISRYGTGCTGSRFLNGTLTLHKQLEERLARFLGKPACITSGTGFQTNVGVFGALMARGDVIFSDRDNHASIVDGCRLSFARTVKFKHKDVEDLERVVSETPCEGTRMIVTDGVFSMLGDLAPLPGIVEVAKRHDAVVMVDDAHAVGVFGAHGRGTPEHFGVEADVPLVVGTFSKSFACLGGFVAGDKDLIDFTKHTSRSVVFSASMTPASVATVLKCLEIVEREPERRTRLWDNVRRMKEGFLELGFDVIGNESPILSIVIGDDDTTFLFNRMLFDEGVFVNPVIPPAVPEGKSLLRTSYMATHTEEELESVLSAFKRVGERLRILR